MKIAVDLRPLQIGHENRGIGTYLLNVLEYFPKNSDEHSYIFIRYRSSNPMKDLDIADGRIYEEVLLRKIPFSPKPKGFLKFLINELSPKFTKLRKFHPDVFFQPDYLLGVPKIKDCRTIIVAYDLIPLRFKSMYLPEPKRFRRARHLRLRTRIRLTLRAYFYRRKYQSGIKILRTCDRILSISKNTTKDLIELGSVQRDKIRTIPLAASFLNSNQPDVSSNATRVISNLNKPYITFIGGTDKRRQVDKLVGAFNMLRGRGLDLGLVLAGNEFVEDSAQLSTLTKKEIEKSSYKDSIVMLGKISEADKYFMLSHSKAFVYPTLYEGFGLPILEAMQAGCPVITYKNSSIPEVSGDAVLYVDIRSTLGIFHALEKLFSSDSLANSLIEKGKKQSSKFTWERNGKKTWNEITSLVEGRGV